MISVKKTQFEQAITYLGTLKPQLESLPRSVTDTVCEIRIRSGQPIVLECTGRKNRIRLSSIVTSEHINECIGEFCNHSIHSFERQFREGFITLRGGHRAGFTGTAVVNGGIIETVRDVSSINLRIAKEYIGCSDYLHRLICNDESSFRGLLIIGRPMSAKTTILRDLCRKVSENNKVALIDERSEIAAVYNGSPTLDVGGNTDVLNAFPKSQGIVLAIRSLSPEYLFCDEIGDEVNEVATLASSGVKTIITAHGGGIGEAYSSQRIRPILVSGGISHVVVLGHGENIGRIEFYGNNRLFNADYSGCVNSADFGELGRGVFFPPTENAGRYTR